MVLLRHPDSRHVVARALRDESIRIYLESLKNHHLETYRHSVRVGLISTDIGLGINLSVDELRILCSAALLHDIGKLRVSGEILSKPSALDDREREAINRHPRLGFLELDRPGFDITRSVVVCHHEYKMDPYPRKTKDRRLGERGSVDRRRVVARIQLFGQIVAAADIYDALANRRSYKPPLSLDQITQTMNDLYIGAPVWMEEILARHI